MNDREPDRQRCYKKWFIATLIISCIAMVSLLTIGILYFMENEKIALRLRVEADKHRIAAKMAEAMALKEKERADELKKQLTALRPPAHPTVTFLEGAEAKAAISDDSLESYFSQLQPMEMSAKTGTPITGNTLEEQRKECRRRYQAGVLNFTRPERAAISWHVNTIIPILLKNYPLIGRIPWSLLKVSDKIEGGLPHTRGKHIVLPASVCSRMVMARTLPESRRVLSWTLDLLIHEQMHVFQRIHPQHCDSLYTELWGFQKAESIKACKWLEEHHLANPDAVDCPWLLTIRKEDTVSHLWPLVVFAEGKRIKSMPFDFRMIAIDLDKTNDGYSVKQTEDGKPVFRSLLSVAEFRKLFPLSSNIYHPVEASADMFAKLVIYDAFVAKDSAPSAETGNTEKHLAPLRTWFRDNLKLP